MALRPFSRCARGSTGAQVVVLGCPSLSGPGRPPACCWLENYCRSLGGNHRGGMGTLCWPRRRGARDGRTALLLSPKGTSRSPVRLAAQQRPGQAAGQTASNSARGHRRHALARPSEETGATAEEVLLGDAAIGRPRRASPRLKRYTAAPQHLRRAWAKQRPGGHA